MAILFSTIKSAANFVLLLPHFTFHCFAAMAAHVWASKVTFYLSVTSFFSIVFSIESTYDPTVSNFLAIAKYLSWPGC